MIYELAFQRQVHHVSRAGGRSALAREPDIAVELYPDHHTGDRRRVRDHRRRAGGVRPSPPLAQRGRRDRDDHRHPDRARHPRLQLGRVHRLAARRIGRRRRRADRFGAAVLAHHHGDRRRDLAGPG